MNQSKLTNTITNRSLAVLSIGEFEGEFFIKKEFANLLSNTSIIESNGEYKLLKAHVVWSNDKYLFIKNDNNITISIRKDQLPIDVKKYTNK